MAKKFEDFTKLYPLSKTLRFEARPIGATKDNIIKNGLLEEDKHRAKCYVKVKKLIDECHKAFIDRVLNDGGLNYDDKGEENSLQEYYALYSTPKKDEAAQKRFKDIQQSLRDQIVEKLTKNSGYKPLFNKELIEKYIKLDEAKKYLSTNFIKLYKERLIKEATNSKKSAQINCAYLICFIDTANSKQLLSLNKEDAIDLVQEFCKFTTYFKGFHENRKNMYSPEEKSTSIANRLINENLPKFIDNMETFKKIVAIPEIEGNLAQLYSEFAEYMNVENIQEMFQLSYYNMLLTQKQIDVYNAIIGGINQYINDYNQHHKESKLPKLKILFKQILSDKNAISWLPEEFKDDQETLNAIKDCHTRLTENVLGDKILKGLLCSLCEYDSKGIFLRNDSQLTDISLKMFGSRSVIPSAIKNDIKNVVPAKKRKETEEDYEKRLDGLFQKQDSFSIYYIDSCLDKFIDNNTHSVEEYFATLGAIGSSTNIFLQVTNAYNDVKSLLNSAYPKNKELAQDKENVATIKIFLDALMSLVHFVKPLLGKGDESDKDEKFYGDLSLLWTELGTIIPLYNMVRNYMTRKPFSNSKIKLNFDNPQILGSWDANKETDYASILMRREGKYYLAIMDKDFKKLLGKSMPSDGDCYEKMVYKQFDITKQLPKCTTERKAVKDAINQGKNQLVLSDTKDWNKPITITRDLWNLNNLVWDKKKQKWEVRKKDNETRPKKFQKAYLKQTNDYKGYNKAKDKWIGFVKEFVSSYKKTEVFGKISFKDSYESVDELYKQLDCDFYKVSFTNVSKTYIDQLVEVGYMYLFQIYNKDFSEYSKGTPNMHTLYWKALFDEQNLVDVVYQLNGGAELFFRESKPFKKIVHPANIPIKNKNKYNKKKESVFEYDLIKDHRYTVDKFMFHVPITLNFKCTGNDNINTQVWEYLKSSDDTHVIGVDRGERNLLYLVVIDLKGNIKEQYSLNKIINEYKGDTHVTDYHELLDNCEEDRYKARLNWQTIESIKELKEGYLSQVVHKIAQLVVKYHAIVVLENLNTGFMRSRQKKEKQVYQKFEKALIDKLGYLVNKQIEAGQTGGLRNAYQFAGSYKRFNQTEDKKSIKQCGFIFYIPAWKTSKIDPVTGFANLLNTRFNTKNEMVAFLTKFNSIRFNKSKNWFEFELDYSKFGNTAEETRTKWTLCTQGMRIKKSKINEKGSVVDLSSEFKSLFIKYKIDINNNLKEAIVNQVAKKFFVDLMKRIRLMLQMRNTDNDKVGHKDSKGIKLMLPTCNTDRDKDYITSPVADENGNFYDSRTCNDTLPENADANGAYNIARKGLMLIEQIKKAKDLANIKFDISNKSWLNFAQQKPYKDD